MTASKSTKPSPTSRQGSVDDSDAALSSSSSSRKRSKRPSVNRIDDDRTADGSNNGTSEGSTTASLSLTSTAFETPNEARHRILSVFHRQPVSSSSTRDSQEHLTPLGNDDHALRGRSGPTLPESPTSYFSARTNASPSRNTRSNALSNDLRTSSIRRGTALSPGSSGMTRSLSQLTDLSVTSQRSNMSPPRPTRSLPRRNASARTLNRPVLSSNNAPSSSSSNVLRARSASNSTVLSTSSSNANILAANASLPNRQPAPTGCGPFNGSFDPNSHPPSGMSTPRTPLAEIPLWLADMRSESRRSSSSSASFLDRDDWVASMQPSTSRHSRTASMTSTPPSPRQSEAGDSYNFYPSTPSSSQGQIAGPAMSTRSRTLGRTSSVRRPRRMTNSLSIPVLNAQQPPEQPNLLGLGVDSGAPSLVPRSRSRSNSRTRSPPMMTRSLRRRSVLIEPRADDAVFGPQPRPLAPLQIPGRATEPDSISSFAAEPISPSAFSEMTSLTQGSTAAESSSSSSLSANWPSTPLPTDRLRVPLASDHRSHYTRSATDDKSPTQNDRVLTDDTDHLFFLHRS